MDQYLSCRDVTELTLNMLLNGTPKPRERGGPRLTQQQIAHLRSVRSVCKTWMDMADQIFVFQPSHLLLAISKTCNESVQFLIERVSIDRGKWNAALSLAISRESYGIVRCLMKHTHYTPQLGHILKACQQGNVQIFQTVRETGPPFHIIQRQMWMDCSTKKHNDMLRHLIEHPQLPFDRTDSGLCQLLSQAVAYNSIDVLSFLLNLSTSLELLDGHSLALKTASLRGDIEKMKLLLRHPRTDATQDPQCLFTHHTACLELLLEDEKMVRVMLQLFREGAVRIINMPNYLRNVAHLRKMKDIVCEIDQSGYLIWMAGL
ncbi:hypothetical protein PROFUN_05377 [Planoprotostelium fungivorum]|uniref:Uncharacterized protein n=1 Tax=Planoprotostelium fungivorum TaxID=1890364 RepID=A0A2P6NRF5_9EUKA|nr:hypothetical protein PROFUN_05377 [Planoprotostelium fungivorum]